MYVWTPVMLQLTWIIPLNMLCRLTRRLPTVLVELVPMQWFLKSAA